MENRKPKNESAFPEPFVNDPHLSISHTKGMTLRDYFAAKAMQGLSSDSTFAAVSNRPYEEVLSETAYRIADAMLKARDNG